MSAEGPGPDLVPPPIRQALHTSGLLASPSAWAGHAHWTLRLPETDWVLALLGTWAVWRSEPQAPQRLHLLVSVAQAPSPQDWADASHGWPSLQPLASECAQACWGLLPGLHAIGLAQGRLQLMIWVGHGPAAQSWLDQTPHQLWALPPTRLAGPAHVTNTASTPARCATPVVAAQGQALVLGSGLAGASAAWALAQRGFSVTVLDGGPTPAHGASGLPVGLMAPHVSGDDNPLSRLTRAGLRQVLDHAQAHLQAGTDWCASGLLERRMGDKARRGRWPQAWRDAASADGLPLVAAAQEWFFPASAAQHLQAGLPAPDDTGSDAPKGIWHRQAGWMKPARLVASLLDHPHIRWQGHVRIDSLQPGSAPHTWLARSERGESFSAEQVVVALGPSSAALLQALCPQAAWPLEALRGQVTGGPMDAPARAWAPPHPVNGLGSFLGDVPMADAGRMWWYGSTYDHLRHQAICLPQDRDSNLAQVQTLLPRLAAHLSSGASPPTDQWMGFRDWSGVRCTTSDRLPVVGPLAPLGAPGVHVLTALGSRGISLGLLCGQLLAAQICGEPLPVEPQLAHLLRPNRFKNKP